MSLPAGTIVNNGFALSPDGALYVTLSGGAATSPFLAADGSAGAPSYSFSTDPTTGFYKVTAGILELSISGAQSFRFSANGLFFAQSAGQFVLSSGGALGWSSGTAGSASTDLTLVRDAANTLAQKNGNSPQEQRIYAGNGGFLSNVVCINESLTIAAAATTDSAFSVPAGAILLAASVRVTTVIPTAATFTVTTATGGTTLSTAAVSTAANSTDAGTAAGASYRSAATKIRITPNLTPGAATGVVRICAYYLQVTPPTS